MAGGSGTYGQVRQAISLLEKHRVEYNVLCTLTNEIARYPKRIWSQLCKLDIRYVQFTPCLDELEKSGESIFALTPRRFSSFYKGLFPLWLESLQKGNYRSIKFFDDVVNLMAFGIPTACGINGVCQPQVVIEADGSVYPCDFYCLDCYSMGNITRNRLSDMQDTRTDCIPEPGTQDSEAMRQLPVCSVLRRKLQTDAAADLLRGNR